MAVSTPRTCQACGVGIARHKYCGSTCSTEAKRIRDTARQARLRIDLRATAERTCVMCNQAKQVTEYSKHATACKSCCSDYKARRQTERRMIAKASGAEYRTREQVIADKAERLLADKRRKLVRRILASAMRASVKRIRDMKRPYPLPRGHAMTPYAIKYRANPSMRLASMTRIRDRKVRQRTGQHMPNDGTVTVAVLNERNSCPYCNSPIDAFTCSVDHMDPLHLGGVHSASNVVACCLRCNHRKGHRPFSISVSNWTASSYTSAEDRSNLAPV